LLPPTNSSIYSRISARRALFLLLSVVFLVASSTASSVSAAGGDIEIVSTDESVNFPGNMDLSVTAEGDADIVDVRLYYHTVGSRIWTYAYPDFVPANRITATLNLTGEVSTYLPPGTEVEYYYEITDAHGNVLQTELALVEYEDTRFDWDEVKVGPLTLRYYDQSGAVVRSVAKKLESDLARLQDVLQIEQADEIKGVIYSKRSHTLDAFPQQSRTTTEQQTFQGFAFPERSIFLGLGMERGLIVHESAHLMLGQAMGDNALPTPAWLDEGFASYMDPSVKIFSGGSLNSRTNSLRAMNTVTGTPHSIGTFYQKSLSVVAFMMDRFGETQFQRLITELGQGSTMDIALTRVYGFDIDGLDARWAGEIATKRTAEPSSPGRLTPDPERPSPILLFNSWLLGGLILLVLGAVSIQYVASKLRPERYPKDGLQPWEDPDLWDDDDDLNSNGPY